MTETSKQVWRAAAGVLCFAAALAATEAVAQTAPYNKQQVSITSAGLKLVGYSYKPAGAGPFPTVIWNHGSEKDPAGGGAQFDSAAAVFVPAGYAVFATVRRGHSGSEGTYIVD